MSNFYDELGLKGLVIIEDLKNNKTIVKKHNMILQSAKNVLFSKLISGIMSNKKINDLDKIYDENLLNITLKAIKIGWSDSDVSYTESNLNEISENNNQYITLDLNIENCEITTDSAGIYYVLKFVSNIEYDMDEWKPSNSKPDNILINTLGIVMGNINNTDKDMLFSRIMFDPIVISPDSDLKLTYYVYF